MSLEHIARFLRREMEIVPFAKSFLLKLVDIDGRAQQVNKFVPDLEKGSTLESQRLADMIFEEANEIASSFDQPTRFEVWCYTEQDEETKKARRRLNLDVKLKKRSLYSFRLQPRRRASGQSGLMESEPSTERGVLGQMMRHTEASQKLLIESQVAMTEALLRENARLTRKSERDDETWMQNRRVTEELMSLQSDRDLAAEKQRMDLSRKEILTKKAIEEVFPMMKQILPSLIDMGMKKLGIAPSSGPLAGQPAASPHAPAQLEKGGPEAPADTGASAADIKKAIKEIFDKLPPEKALELYDMLPEEQLKKLTTLLEA